MNELQSAISTAQEAEKLGVIGVLFLVLIGLVAYNYYLTRDIKKALEAIEKNLEKQNEIFNLQLAFLKEHLFIELKHELLELKKDVKELLDHCKENNAIKYGRRKNDT